MLKERIVLGLLLFTILCVMSAGSVNNNLANATPSSFSGDGGNTPLVNTTTPPTEGGDTTTPPTEGGDTTTPPTEGGDTTTPPTEGG